MKNVVPLRGMNHIEEEAAAWVARIDGGELSDADKVRLQTWLAESTRHAAAFERVAKLWNEMACLELLAEIVPVQKAQPQRHSWLAGASGRGLLQKAAAATLAVILIGGLLLTVPGDFLPWNSLRHSTIEAVYQTRTGERSQVVLSDGSTVTLNTRSEMRVRFDERQRSVYLNTGEAYFEVAPNARAPFVVYAGNGAVRAVGTGFNVRLMDQAVEVAVAEGTVSVSTTHSEHVQASALKVQAGEAARFAGQMENPRRLSSSQLPRRLAWREGKWAFDGQTLDEVIRDISRYTNQRLEIIDPSIRQIRIGGYFDVGEIDPFLDALDAGFGIKHERISEGLIFLSARQFRDG